MLHCHLNAVQASGVDGCQDQIGIGVGVAGTKLEAGSHGVLQITDQASQDGAVAGRNLRAVAQGSDNADRSLEAGLQTVQRVISSRNKGVDYLIILQHAHECTIAHSAHEVLPCLGRSKEIVEFAIFGDSGHANMGVFTVAGQTDDGLGLEAHFQTIGTEDFLYHHAHQNLIICSLHGIVETPVNLNLLTDMGNLAALINLSLEAAHFLMAHLHIQAVAVQLQHVLLHEFQRICQHGTRVNALALMHQESGNAQGAYGLAQALIIMLVVVIHEPVHRGVDRHIKLGVVQGGDAGEHNGRTVGLHSRTCIEIIYILNEDAHGNLLIGIIAGHVDAHQGNELDFRMLAYILEHFFLAGISGNYIQKFIHLLPPFLK